MNNYDSKTFIKDEKLCSKKIIEKLFAEGQSGFNYPFRAVFIKKETVSEFPAQVLISVSKRKIRKATDRNFLKRRIREAYRLNKPVLYNFLQDNQIKIAFAIIYISNKKQGFNEIENQLIKLFHVIIANLESE